MPEDRDACSIGGRAHGGAVEGKRSARLDGEARRPRGAHGFDGGQADDRDIEAQILLRLGDLDDGERAGEGGGGDSGGV